MTYFHIRTYTIIGAESFHGPVRDGKGWDQLAMVVRQTVVRDQLSGVSHTRHPPDAFGRSKRF